MRLLIVEDDVKTARALAAGLERGGFSVATAHTGEDGFFLLNAESFDGVVLDWMLPARSGLEILKTLRARGDKTPVLVLTARDAVENRVLGLESGTDDYLVKPFALWALRIYRLILLLLIGIKLVRVFSSSHASNHAAPGPPAPAAPATNQAAVAPKP